MAVSMRTPGRGTEETTMVDVGADERSPGSQNETITPAAMRHESMRGEGGERLLYGIGRETLLASQRSSGGSEPGMVTQMPQVSFQA